MRDTLDLAGLLLADAVIFLVAAPLELGEWLASSARIWWRRR